MRARESDAGCLVGTVVSMTYCRANQLGSKQVAIADIAASWRAACDSRPDAVRVGALMSAPSGDAHAKLVQEGMVSGTFRTSKVQVNVCRRDVGDGVWSIERMRMRTTGGFGFDSASYVGVADSRDGDQRFITGTAVRLASPN